MLSPRSMPPMGHSNRRRSGITWGQILILSIATGLAVHFAWDSYQRAQERQRPVAVQPSPAQASAPRPRPARRQQAAPAQPPYELQDGERCMSGKYLYRIEGGWADDPGQDWKCRRVSGRQGR